MTCDTSGCVKHGVGTEREQYVGLNASDDVRKWVVGISWHTWDVCFFERNWTSARSKHDPSAYRRTNPRPTKTFQPLAATSPLLVRQADAPMTGRVRYRNVIDMAGCRQRDGMASKKLKGGGNRSVGCRHLEKSSVCDS